MKERIKELSFRFEFFTVILLSFGYFTLISLIYFIEGFLPGQSMGADDTFTNESLISLAIHELIFLALVLTFLKLRDNPIDLNNSFKPISLMSYSLLLVLSYYVIYFALAYLINGFNLNLYSLLKLNGNLNPFVVTVISTVNPVYEELIVVGYIIPSLSSRKGTLFAVNTSIFIRVLYHLYQGPSAIVSIVPLGIIFALAYLKWKNIWPLVIAHGILDFISLC